MRSFIAVLLLAVLCTGAQAQRRDPMTGREVEQMRDSAQEPTRRIELMIGFTRERVLAMERLRSTGSDAARIEELLGKLAALIDELDDNLAMYSEHGKDLRSPLRHVLQAEAEFQQKLKAIGDEGTAAQRHRLAVSLEDASDSLEDSTESAKAMLASQIAKRGSEKDKAKPGRREARDGAAKEPAGH